MVYYVNTCPPKMTDPAKFDHYGCIPFLSFSSANKELSIVGDKIALKFRFDKETF